MEQTAASSEEEAARGLPNAAARRRRWGGRPEMAEEGCDAAWVLDGWAGGGRGVRRAGAVRLRGAGVVRGHAAVRRLPGLRTGAVRPWDRPGGGEPFRAELLPRRRGGAAEAGRAAAARDGPGRGAGRAAADRGHRHA